MITAAFVPPDAHLPVLFEKKGRAKAKAMKAIRSIRKKSRRRFLSFSILDASIFICSRNRTVEKFIFFALIRLIR